MWAMAKSFDLAISSMTSTGFYLSFKIYYNPG